MAKSYVSKFTCKVIKSPAELMELWAEGTPMKSYNVKPSDMTPSDQSMTVEKEEKLQKETVPELQSTRLLDSLKVENTTFILNSILERTLLKRNSAMQICLMRSEGRHDSFAMMSSNIIHFSKNGCRKLR